MSSEKIIRRKNTNKKKRQRVIAASITAILLGTVTAGFGIFFQKNNNENVVPENPIQKNIYITESMLKKINIGDIQKKLIDAKEIEENQQYLFNAELKKYLIDILNVNEIDVLYYLLYFGIF